MKKDKRYLIQYWQYLKKHKWLLGVGAAMIPLITLFHLLQPYLIKVGIDQYILKGDMGGLTLIAVLFGACVLLDFGCKSCQVFVFNYIGQRTIVDIRKDLFIHVMGFPSAYYDKTPVGVVASRLTSDMESLNDSFASGLVTLLADLLTLIGIVVFMFMLSPKLTAIILCVIPIVMVVVNFFRIKLRYFYSKIRSTIGKMHAYVQEHLQGVSVLQLFQKEYKSYQEFKRLNNIYRKSTIGSVIYDALLYSIIDSFNYIVIALIIWVSWGQYHQDLITLGLLVAFIDYIHKFFTPLKEISSKFATLQHALAALEKIFGTFDISDSLQSGNELFNPSFKRIVFDRISFAYPTHPSKKVLNNVSFELKKGDVFAIVGSTGSGKTTAFRLLSRLYDGYEGRICIDGAELSHLSLTSLRQHISVVSQDVSLFSDTIAFNISLGAPDITHDRIQWAAKAVNIHDFIMTLPQGYETVLDKGAQSLSSGQAQLISFARALASSSPILLLDEATSAVDSLSEQAIQKALETLFKEKTTLVIAHRLSTIQHADCILTFDKGELIESGTHEELMIKNGFYANLFNMQFASL